VLDGKNKIKERELSVEEAKKRKEKEKKKGMEKKGKLPLCRSKIIFKYFINFFIHRFKLIGEIKR
jgi:hypothetical protein